MDPFSLGTERIVAEGRGGGDLRCFNGAIEWRTLDVAGDRRLYLVGGFQVAALGTGQEGSLH